MRPGARHRVFWVGRHLGEGKGFKQLHEAPVTSWGASEAEERASLIQVRGSENLPGHLMFALRSLKGNISQVKKSVGRMFPAGQ